MNILFLEQHPRFGGGSERMTLSLCAYFHASGHSTHLVHESGGDMLEAYGPVTSSVTQARIRPAAVRKPLEALRSLVTLRRLARSRQIDVVFTSQLGYVSLLGIARRLWGIPSAVHIGLPLSFGSPLYAWARGYIAAAVTPSEAMREKCLRLGWPAGRLHVVENGVDPARFHPSDDRSPRAELGLQDEDFLMVYAGRLVAEKGIFTLARACGQLVRRRIAFHLLVLGEGPGSERQEMEALVAQEGVDHARITFLGIVPRPERYLAAADVAVIPSEWPEPFGLAAVEAMACGAVPVVSDAGMLPNLVGSDAPACIFRQRDAAELADRLEFLIRDPGARSRLRNRMIARASERYDLRICGARYEQILGGLTGKPACQS